MMSAIEFTKIAVFYDGNFFSHVSNYYLYHHPRHSRISISGLHDFIRREISVTDGTNERFCQVVDAHYFRGRLRTADADQRDMLIKERLFDEMLLREGVTTHYLPLMPTGEKGIDVWMALEALELSLLKRYDVCVLVASDGDFLPLVRKLNSVGTCVMVMGWEFRYRQKNGVERETKTAQSILREATYPLLMHERIELGLAAGDAHIDALFFPSSDARPRSAQGTPRPWQQKRRETPITTAETSGDESKDASVPVISEWVPDTGEIITPVVAHVDADTPPPSVSSNVIEDATELPPREVEVTPEVMNSDVEKNGEDDGYWFDLDEEEYSSTNEEEFETFGLERSDSRARETIAGDANNGVEQLHAQSEQRVRGIIAYLKDGYGFISPEDGGEDIYFYHTELLNADYPSLRVDMKVEFEPGRNDRGPCALDILVGST